MNMILCIVALSDKIFASVNVEIRFWHIDYDDCYSAVTLDDADRKVYTVIKKGEDLIFAGQHQHVGVLKIKYDWICKSEIDNNITFILNAIINLLCININI